MKSRNITLFFSSILFLIILFPACHSSKNDNNTKEFNSRVKKLNKSINKVDNTITLFDSLQNELNKINKDLAEGKITVKEALNKKNILEKNLGRKVARTTNYHPAKNFPDWAKALGLTPPKGMKLDSDYSQITSVNNPDEGFNSVLMVYKSNYNIAMQQAAEIAKKAHIPLIKEYKAAFEMKKKYNEEIVKGAVYMNFEPGDPSQPKYAIAITVDENGLLTISATNTRQMENQLIKDKTNLP